METENNQLLWKSRSNGHKSITLLATWFGLLILSIVGIFIISYNDIVSETFKAIYLVIAMLVIMSGLVLVILIRLTDLKWNASNLLFGLAESGLYFTGVKNQDSYFFAEWSEILDYSLATDKKGRVTVTVNFNCIAYAGSYGKIRHLKMVNITGVDEMCKIFEKFGINQIGLSKN